MTTLSELHLFNVNFTGIVIDINFGSLLFYLSRKFFSLMVKHCSVERSSSIKILNVKVICILFRF